MIVDEIIASFLTVVPSLGETDAQYRGVFPSGNGDIVGILTEEIPPPLYLLIALAHHFQIGSRFVVTLTVSCVSMGSTGHNNALCEHPPAMHAVENAR